MFNGVIQITGGLVEPSCQVAKLGRVEKAAWKPDLFGDFGANGRNFPGGIYRLSDD